jgi:S-adenosylmethionine-diacylglycerol 3-amino-3-carboxypropyl transferase
MKAFGIRRGKVSRMDRIEKRAAFSYIRYANCWEDAEILLEALQPGPGKCFLSVASAGDNSLALLASGASVVAVDLNPSQLACVELRREAIRRLDHSACLEFLGIHPCSERLATFQSLHDGLSDSAREFWAENQNLIDSGFIHAGKFEKYFHLFRNRIIPLIHPQQRVRTLLQEKSREERIEYYQKSWSNWRWRALFRIFFSRFVMGRMGRDPEFFRYVDGPVSVHIQRRAEYALTELETHSNPYLRYILTGNFGPTLPYYLQPEVFAGIKKNIDGLTPLLGPIEKVVAQFEGVFSGFNLSDIFEYLDDPTCRSIYEILLDHADPGARFAYWNMLVPRSRPEALKDRVKELPELSSELLARDKAFFYSRFVVEEKR